mmetsp:Transcript_12936/g.19645  ORF Transcript_12936/g.19645 Transcript_12936/m.19645 type:complete len:85 (+) Transcript_12936:746-1000(+)
MRHKELPGLILPFHGERPAFFDDCAMTRWRTPATQFLLTELEMQMRVPPRIEPFERRRKIRFLQKTPSRQRVSSKQGTKMESEA